MRCNLGFISSKVKRDKSCVDNDLDVIAKFIIGLLLDSIFFTLGLSASLGKLTILIILRTLFTALSASISRLNSKKILAPP